MAAGYFFTGEQDLTPEGLDRKRALLNALRKDNLSAAPVGHWTQALARVVGAGADSMEEAQLNRTEKAGTEKAKAELMKVLGIGGAASPGAPTAAAGAPASVPAAAPSDVPAPTGKPALPIMAQQDPSAALIRSFEGYRDKPYWDVNAHRVGYGSDTVTNPDGSVQRVQPGMQINRQQAELDLQRRISTEFQPRAASAVGENWAKLSPQAQAALTSVTYNYGSLPKSVAAAAQTGDPNAIAQAVEGLAGHNGGINANRRMKEAELIRGGDMPAAGAQAAQFNVPGQVPASPPAPNAQALMAALSNPWAARSPALMQLAASVAGKQLSRDPVEDMKNRLQLQQMLRDADMPKTQVFKEGDEEVTRMWNPATRTWDRPSFGGQGQGEGNSIRTLDGRNIPIQPGMNSKEARKIVTKESTEAVMAAPKAFEALRDTEKYITALEKDPGLPDITGKLGAIRERLPGTDAMNARSRIDQLTGRVFLTAFEALKGGGQITEVEGNKAQAAMARLNNPRIGEAAYREALKDFKDAVREGMTKLQRLPGMEKYGTAPSSQPKPGAVVIDGWQIERVN